MHRVTKQMNVLFIHLRYVALLKREITLKERNCTKLSQRVNKIRKKLQLKYISKGHFQTVTFRGIIPVLHLLILFDQVLCNTTLQKQAYTPA